MGGGLGQTALPTVGGDPRAPRLVGEDWEAKALAEELLKNADIMSQSGGGITFSGGEPLAQAEFVEAVIEEVRGQAGALAPTIAIETSGYAAPEVYRRVIAKMDFVYQDLKHHDADAFHQGTGGDLRVVLDNLNWLKTSGIDYKIRVPVIPGINDSTADREQLAALIGSSPVEYLPYNPAAGAKYPLLGRKYMMEAH